MTTTKALLFGLLLSVGACELDEAEYLTPPPPAPTIEGAPTAQEGSICDDFAPEHCTRGYNLELADDGQSWLCVHSIGCPVLATPCKYGEQRGDPTFQVRCRVSDR